MVQAATTLSEQKPLTRTQKMRIAVRYMLEHGGFAKGEQSRLAEYFGVRKQRIGQIVKEERAALISNQTAN